MRPLTRIFYRVIIKIKNDNEQQFVMNKTKCITFDKVAQDALPEHIKAKMKADRDNARTEQLKQYAYCKKSYINDGIAFDEGYIEAIPKGETFLSNANWRYATVDEVRDFFSEPTFKRPKGRYSK